MTYIREQLLVRLNVSGTLTTAGGLIFLGPADGTVAAFDDTTLEEMWRTNLGS
jgi:glucose dehydrogenase